MFSKVRILLVNTLINLTYLYSHSKLWLEKTFFSHWLAGRWQSSRSGEITIRLINSCKLSKGVHLQFTINECLKEKSFPTKRKLAYVTPISKNGDKLESRNYRSISVTPSFAKISERLLLTQMAKFIDSHKIINKEQFGFQKKMSATDGILELVETVSANSDQSKETAAIFLDPKKRLIPFWITFSLEKLNWMVFSRKRKNYCFYFLPTANKW